MKDHIRELIEKYPTLTPIKTRIDNAYNILQESFSNGGKLLIGGNGGSCADADHIVGELMKGFIKRREISDEFGVKLRTVDSVRGRKLSDALQGALPAINLMGHMALNSAFANDVDPVLTVAQQVYGYGNAGDSALFISTSGNAENLMYAAVVAKAKGLKVIALVGKEGGKLSKIADVAIVVPKKDTYEIQEYHLPIYHALCLQLEEYFF